MEFLSIIISANIFGVNYENTGWQIFEREKVYKTEKESITIINPSPININKFNLKQIEYPVESYYGYDEIKTCYKLLVCVSSKGVWLNRDYKAKSDLEKDLAILLKSENAPDYVFGKIYRVFFMNLKDNDEELIDSVEQVLSSFSFYKKIKKAEDYVPITITCSLNKTDFNNMAVTDFNCKYKGIYKIKEISRDLYYVYDFENDMCGEL